MDSPSIDIQVFCQYLAEQSSPEAGRYAFAYTVNIQNDSSEDVQLISRYWRIVDGQEQVQEVRGEGVVGQQPTIPAGGRFRYSSGAVLETPTGTMEGSYQMESASGLAFEAPIPLFLLAEPSALH